MMPNDDDDPPQGQVHLNPEVIKAADLLLGGNLDFDLDGDPPPRRGLDSMNIVEGTIASILGTILVAIAVFVFTAMIWPHIASQGARASPGEDVAAHGEAAISQPE